MRVSGSRAAKYLAQTFDGQGGREGDSYGVGGKMKASANSDLETKIGVWCAEIQVKMNRKRELRVKVWWLEMVYSRPEWLLGRTSVANLYFNFFPVSV